MTKSKSSSDCKARVAAYYAARDPAYEAFPYDPFEDVTTKPRRRRRFSLARAITQARKSGAAVTVAPDGAITLQFGATSGAAPDVVDLAPVNEWDTL